MKPSRRLQTENNLALATALFIALVATAERFPGERWWPTLLLAYAPQQIWAIPPLAACGYFLGRRRWALSLVMLPLIAFVPFRLIGATLSQFQPKAPSNLRVVSWNLYYGRGGPSVPDLALDTMPDIICLQEANPWGERSLSDLLKLPQFRGWQAKSCGELVVLSRFPLKRLKTTNSALWVAADIGGTEVVVVNVHLALPVSSNVAKMLDPSQLYADERRRRPQVRGLVENLPVDRPVVVCGDFNTPPNTAVYRTLSSALDNSFRKAGTGLGLTYPRRFPLVRIDHIFVSRDIKPVRCWTLDIDASNHKPLCADLQMPD